MNSTFFGDHRWRRARFAGDCRGRGRRIKAIRGFIVVGSRTREERRGRRELKTQERERGRGNEEKEGKVMIFSHLADGCDTWDDYICLIYGSALFEPFSLSLSVYIWYIHHSHPVKMNLRNLMFRLVLSIAALAKGHLDRFSTDPLN